MQDYDDLDDGPRDTPDDWAELELVYAEPRSEDSVQALINEVFGEGLPVSAVFDAQSDHHFFLTLVGRLRMYEEEAVFELAREYRPILKADEINPSLIGGIYSGRARDAPNLRAGLCSTPEVSLSPTGWPHQMIGTKFGWNTQNAPKGQGGIVAVIDTGHSSHDELSGMILTQGQLNLVEGGTDARDRFNAGFGQNSGHGTLVCSVLASRGDIDSGFNMTAPGKITGVAPAADILPIRAFRSVINLTQRTIPRAIIHATHHGARVITMAMGAPYRISATEKAMRQAVNEGVLIVCAAGNCWRWTVFPAAYAPIHLCSAVGAVQHDKSAWPPSSRGPETTISAPGENVWGATKTTASSPDNAVKPAQGTTLATAITSGAAILWSTAIGSRRDLKNLAQNKGMTGQQLFNRILMQTAERPISWPSNHGMGAGILRIDRMFQTAHNGRNVARTDAGDLGPDIDLPLAPWGTVRTIDILRMQCRARELKIENELRDDMADYAPEILWRVQLRDSGRTIDETPSWLRDFPVLRSYLAR